MISALVFHVKVCGSGPTGDAIVTKTARLVYYWLNGVSGPLNSVMISALISHAEVDGSNPVGCAPAVEMTAWIFLEMGKEKWPGLMFAISPSSALTRHGKYGH